MSFLDPRSVKGRRVLSLVLAVVLLGLTAHDAFAARKRKPVKRKRARSTAAARYTGPTYDSALIIEAETGTVLFQKDPHVQRAPASLAKMMLELVTLEALRDGRLSLHDTMVVPLEAAKMRGSRVRLRTGEVVTVRDLLYATAIASANDAATALAIKLAGSTEACVALMNRRAHELGMVSTHYRNVHGLDRNDEPGNVTNAWDLAILARELIAMPEALEISRMPDAVIRGKQVIHTTNRLVRQYPGCDGLKTGYTSRAGYCLVSTANREDMRIISVVLGSNSNRRRFSESAGLLDKAFADWNRVRVIEKGQDLGSLAVQRGTASSVRLLAADDVCLLVPANRKADLRVALSSPASMPAPVAEGWKLGSVQVFLGDSVAAECPVVARETVRRATPVERLLRNWLD